jgi:magnesium chelatase family protein
VQRERQGVPNAELPVTAFDAAHGFEPQVLDLVELRGRQLGLSLRRLHRAARVARTIADLAGRHAVRGSDVDEALLHRPRELAA